ncbi:MAG: DUF935 family protein [Gammaproteobacteria bacterium]|nr:DUF935 family protein [Gammaproteobacteria bacterium]
MNTTDLKNASRQNLAREIATRDTDPNFFSALTVLPNPDTVLRRLGKADEAFDAIISDAHVMGELRVIRSALLGFEWRLQAGGETPADVRALELCEQFMKVRPASGLRWPDVLWNMAQAVFRGYQAHEVVWARQDQYLMPSAVVDRPSRRFAFDINNTLRLKTRSQPMLGEELGPYKWLLTRHMPSHDNPYGVALYSSCLWPYTFKHSGFRYFVKFCEKYGIPWAIGKYPPGTSQADQDALADALARMVEDAVAAIPDNGTVELLESSSSGQLVHERLIDISNREMSKALTSQTLATEIQGQGSRAAADTHRGREQDVNESDRTIVADTMSELFAWITEINIAGAQPPRFEFYEEADARQDWVEAIDKARGYINIPAAWAHERLQIPMPQEGEDVLPRTAAAPAMPQQFSSHSCPHCSHDFAADAGGDAIDRLADQAATEADNIIADMAAPIRELLNQVETLEQFRDGLVKLYPKIDDQRLGELTQQALMVGMLKGVDDAG